MTKREMTKTYKNWVMLIKLKLISLKAERERYQYLLRHGTPFQKRNATTALKANKKQTAEQKKALKIKMKECERAYTRGAIERFWNPSWKKFLSPVTV